MTELNVEAMLGNSDCIHSVDGRVVDIRKPFAIVAQGANMKQN